MNRDELGLIGGLAADRPLIATLVSAFGLTALAVIGAGDPMGAPATRTMLVETLFFGGAILGAPLAAASFAPAKTLSRIALSSALLALAAAALIFQPADWFAAPAAFAPSIAAATAIAIIFICAFPVFGSIARLGFVSVFGALLGLAGGIGLYSSQGGVNSGEFGAATGLSLAFGSAAGFSTLSEFSAQFSRGAERRRAAGIAAQDGLGPVAFMALTGAAAFGVLTGGGAWANFQSAWLVGASVLLTSCAALIVTSAALALKRPSELLAVDENLRRQAFRVFWRPIRAGLSPSSANAAVAIAAIAVIAIAFTLSAPITLALCLFIIVSGALAGLLYVSLRAGLFVFFSLLVTAVATKWVWLAAQAPVQALAGEAAALSLSAVLFGQLALAWREARSPRLNARETAEAAMSGAARLYLANAIVGMAAFFALDVAGVWPSGALAAAQAGVMLIFGLLLAPPLMTALSNAVRRELA